LLTLKGRGAIIAGTRRVGATVARRLAQEGVNIAITYRRSAGEAQQLRDEIAGLTEKVVLLQADLADDGQVTQLTAQAREQLGELSVCVNLASDYPRDPLETLDAAAWDHSMAFARANYLLALHAGRAMMRNDGPTRGHLVFFGDWAADETPYHDYLPYLTAKAAIHFMTRAFALELAPYGILVNAIAPGPTSFGVGVSEREWAAAVDATPLKRESSPDDIAEMVVTVLRSETMTGEHIRIDSGRHIAGTARLRRRAESS
jgi:3-oxoacyl-[acyl-carrier protein] reductase